MRETDFGTQKKLLLSSFWIA